MLGLSPIWIRLQVDHDAKEEEESTLSPLQHVHHRLEGGAGEGVGLPGGRGLGDLLLEGVRQAALEELAAGATRLVILGVVRAVTAALVKYGHHRRGPSQLPVLDQRGHFRAWSRAKQEKSHVYIHSKWESGPVKTVLVLYVNITYMVKTC